jgi:hypothetical protein
MLARISEPESTLEAGREEDRLVSGLTYRRATPEAALLHWLYLADSPRSRMSEPPLDLDLESLSAPRLRRLSKAMELKELLESWLSRAGSFDEPRFTPKRAHAS